MQEKKEEKGTTVFSELKERFQLKWLAEALLNQTEVYQKIINGDISATKELKKAVQNSINELCTAISSFVSVTKF